MIGYFEGLASERGIVGAGDLVLRPGAEKSMAAKLAQMLRAVEIEHKTSKTLAYYNRMGMLGSERGPRGPHDPGGKEVVCDGIEHAARSTTNG
jgi:hypothetical protein